jgi:hypothetical protein
VKMLSIGSLPWVVRFGVVQVMLSTPSHGR